MDRAADKPALFVADPKEKALVRHDLASGKQRRLADLPDDGILGFPPVIAVAPAIANAVFVATGVRVRSMPIKLPGSKEA